MLADFSPEKKCFSDEYISDGNIRTAPNAIAQMMTIANKRMRVGKKSLFCLNTCGMYKFHEFKNILACSWAKINKIVFFKTNNTFIFPCIR